MEQKQDEIVIRARNLDNRKKNKKFSDETTFLVQHIGERKEKMIENFFLYRFFDIDIQKTIVEMRRNSKRQRILKAKLVY